MRPLLWSVAIVATTCVGCATALRPDENELSALLRDRPSSRKAPSNWSLVGDARPPNAMRRARTAPNANSTDETFEPSEEPVDEATSELAGVEIASILASLPTKSRAEQENPIRGGRQPAPLRPPLDRTASRKKTRAGADLVQSAPRRKRPVEPQGPDLNEALALALQEAEEIERAEMAAQDRMAHRGARMVRQVSWTRDADATARSFRKPQRPANEESLGDEDESFADEPPRYTKPNPPTKKAKKKTEVEKSQLKSATASSDRDDDPAEKKPLDWAVEQRRTIEALAGKIRQARADGADKAEIARLETLLRLHYLTAGDRDLALKPIEGLPPAEQEYWKHQLFELADMLSTDRAPGDRKRYALALQSLEEAQRRLAELSALALRNAAFCKRVDDFGAVEKFERADFKKNQETLLYVEVGNFTPQKSGEDKFETELQGTYRVLDRSGAARAERTLPLDKQTSGNARRDYYLAYRIFVPAELPPGAYTLELTIEDKKAQKSANTLLEFNVVP